LNFPRTTFHQSKNDHALAVIVYELVVGTKLNKPTGDHPEICTLNVLPLRGVNLAQAPVERTSPSFGATLPVQIESISGPEYSKT
jgi:hypothetical protein